MLRDNTQIPTGSAIATVDAAGGTSVWPGLPAEHYETRWYAAQTSPNHEKRVAEQLSARVVEHFLPLYSSRRQWKDRRVTLELPVFPGYVFVHLALRDRLRAVQVPGVAKLVGFGGTPIPLSDAEIEGLRTGLASRVRAEPCAFLTAGRKVRVKHGPMMGLQGILVRRKSHTRLVVSLELIQRAVAVEIDEADLETA
jgi:transcription antitermination factor NusG